MNARLAKPIPQLLVYSRRVFDLGQALAAARGFAPGQACAAIGRDFTSRFSLLRRTIGVVRH
jgi:hypothetical protein